MSCDYRPTEQPGPHIQGSWFEHDTIKQGWDLMIAHPDCTFLVVSGAKWMTVEWREEALGAVNYIATLERMDGTMTTPSDPGATIAHLL